MTRLYDRRCSVTVNDRKFQADSYNAQGLRVPGLHMSFLIEHSLEKSGNKAEVSIENLSETSRAAISQPKRAAQTVLVGTPAGARALTIPSVIPTMTLEAGYKDALGILFKGEVHFVVHERTNTGFITKITCSDSLKA